ncbi:hypothetical protein HUN01_27750 [Nostoc edaphicum CCNP1411]|uniref:Uncharacterized protein n=1 Tax=Nostoc edaphicum CCNP1411 TaxID=1472755 RepID=A0A7D7QF58_9NOSO|nr:hypothetical protein [Nostoc edaphicum]QMS91199.1 hypothetical protein HUN01_27750 [Nostoc edaphicum CCNP1411]
MNKLLDETLSIKTAEQINSRASTPFDNAYKAALSTEGARYIQGFLAFTGKPYRPIEHSWIEVGDASDVRIIDPTLPHLNKNPEELWYFAAQRLTVKKLKAIIEESKEDYPEDEPLPIYGDPPYEYYGDIMLGGQDYLAAYQAAEAKCKEINELNPERN